MYKLGQWITVDTCGGRWTNKITKIINRDNKTIYETSGDSLTETTAKFINVEGVQTCDNSKCCFKDVCKIKQVIK